MRRIERSAFIQRPAGEVFAFLAAFDRNPEWETGVLRTTQVPDGPVAIGTRLIEERSFLGRHIRTTYEVVEYEPDRRIALESRSGPVQVRGGYTVTPVDGGVRVTDVAEFETGGFFKLAEPLFTRAARSTIDRNLASLKHALESPTQE